MEYIIQIIIAILTTTLGSILAYFKAVKKVNADLEKVKISSQTEIDKIKEESNKKIKEIEIQYESEIKKLRAQTDEIIKLKEAESSINVKQSEEDFKNKVTNDFVQKMFENPEGAIGMISKLKDIEKMLK